MLPRFVQLFILASLILLIPSLLYLSHSPTSSLIDPRTGLAYTADSIPVNTNPLTNSNPLAQVSQGDGVDLSQAKWGLTWKGVENGMIKKPVEKMENTWHHFIDGWKPSKDKDAPQPAINLPKIGPPAVAAAAPKDEHIDGIIMPKMANATAKAALGRSTWHFLHTMTLRFPDNPTKEQSATLKTFFESFAQLYPCGECAKHFQALLKELPPQTGSRMNAALWLCSVHNEVNKSLGKEEFDCEKLDESYDCGCGPEEGETKNDEKQNAAKDAVKPIAAAAPQGVIPLGKRQEEGVLALSRRALARQST